MASEVSWGGVGFRASSGGGAGGPLPLGSSRHIKMDSNPLQTQGEGVSGREVSHPRLRSAVRPIL
jgi:hypothetical protein